MLKTMRKNVKSLAPTLWIVIAAFIIAIFAVWGGAGRLGEKAGSTTIATLGKEKISTEAYYLTLRQRLEGLQKEFRGLNKSFIQQLNIPQQVLEQMIQQNLLRQKADEMGIGVTDKELREKIISLFQRDGKFIGFAEYRRILEWNRMSVPQFEENLKEEILLNKAVRLLTAGIAVTPEELWEHYKKNNETARLEYLLLQESQVELSQPLPLAELEAYFEKNKERYTIPEKREGSYIFFITEDLKKDVQATDSEVEKYYEKNQSQFQEPEKTRMSRIHLPFAGQDKEAVRKRAQDLLARISRGEDFGQVARDSSGDEKAKDGGDWGYDEWRRLPAREREETEKLGQGETSGVVETDEGVSILKVTDKEPAKTKPLEEVKARIKTILEDEKARSLAEEKISQLSKSARRENSLDVAAQKAGLKVKRTGLMKQEEGLDDFDAGGLISRTLFGLKDREISSAIYTFAGIGIVQLERIEPPRPASFEEVREDIEKDLRGARKKDLALERINAARPQVEGKDWEELASKLGLEHKVVNEHRREQYLSVLGESPEVDRLAFSLPLNQTSDPVEFSNGYALVRVLERKEASREEFEKNRETEKNSLLETKKNKFLQAYLNRLREEKDVRINTNLFLQINADILSRFEERE
ncbi:MAG: peptidyl-prolyl cis-trans isomerase [Clostridiales bacterium]|nr:peptidyl-prolyl cis-trans isomerase [Clostridiales bacterium]